MFIEKCKTSHGSGNNPSLSFHQIPLSKRKEIRQEWLCHIKRGQNEKYLSKDSTSYICLEHSEIYEMHRNIYTLSYTKYYASLLFYIGISSAESILLVDLLKQPSGYLHLQSHQWQHRDKVWNMLRIKKKTQEGRHWRRSGILIHNFEYISHLVLVFVLLIINSQVPIENFNVLANFEIPKYCFFILSNIVTTSFRIPIFNWCFVYVFKIFFNLL